MNHHLSPQVMAALQAKLDVANERITQLTDEAGRFGSKLPKDTGFTMEKRRFEHEKWKFKD